MKTMYYNTEYETIHTLEEMQEYHKGYCEMCNIDISFEEYLRNTLTENNGTMEKFNVKAIWKIFVNQNYQKFVYIVFTDRTETEGSFDEAIHYGRKAGYNTVNGGQKQDFDCLNKPMNEVVLFDFEIEEWEGEKE